MYHTIFPSEFLAVFGGIATIFIVLYIFAALVGITLYVLQAYGVYKMGKKLGLSNPWLSFIPIVSVFALGRVAQKYIKRDGTKSAKFSVILLVLNIVTCVAAIAFIISAVFAIITIAANANMAIDNDIAMTVEMFSSIIPFIILYFTTLAAAIAYSVLYYISLWRVFAVFDNGNATLYLVLSVFFSFLPAIFLFAIRNKQPRFTYNERMGFENL